MENQQVSKDNDALEQDLTWIEQTLTLDAISPEHGGRPMTDAPVTPDIGAQLIAHAAGDYLIQSDWMAVNKTSRWGPAVAHAVTYAAAFLPLTRRPRTLALVGGSHLLIDRFRLARHVVWAKNNLAPPGSNRPWAECKATGYDPDRPDWMTVWLLIIADNTMHAICNALAFRAEAAVNGPYSQESSDEEN